MNQLIDLLNSLATKYHFDESDKEKIKQVVFGLQENLEADTKAADFIMPREEHPMEEAYGSDD